jgi:hypothetical protein
MKTAEDILGEFYSKYGRCDSATILAMEEYAQELVNSKINKPSILGFIESVKIEMAHQFEKWGDESHKPLLHHTSVLSYLNGKLIRAIWDGETEKVKHHLMTVAAVAGSAYKYFFPDEFETKFPTEK